MEEEKKDINLLKDIGIDEKYCQAQKEILEKVAEHITAVKEYIDKMRNERKKANTLEDSREKAIQYCDKVRPLMEMVRDHVDKLEILVDDELWPLPKYRELLFIR